MRAMVMVVLLVALAGCGGGEEGSVQQAIANAAPNECATPGRYVCDCDGKRTALLLQEFVCSDTPALVSHHEHANCDFECAATFTALGMQRFAIDTECDLSHCWAGKILASGCVCSKPGLAGE